MKILTRSDAEDFSQEFLKRFSGALPKISNLEIGKPIFTNEDVNRSPHPIDRILRRICVDRGLTKELWLTKSFEYSLNVQGMLPDQARNKANNSFKAILKVQVTLQNFNYFIKVLGFTGGTFTYRPVDEQGNVEEYTVDLH